MTKSLDDLFISKGSKEKADALEEHLIKPVQNESFINSEKTIIEKRDLSDEVAEALDTLVLKFGDECILPAANAVDLMCKESSKKLESKGGFVPQYGEWGYCYGKSLQSTLLWEIRIQLRDRMGKEIQYFYVNAPKSCFVYLSQWDVLTPSLFSPIYLLLREYLSSLDDVNNIENPDFFMNMAQDFNQELLSAGAFEGLVFVSLDLETSNQSISKLQNKFKKEIDLYLSVKYLVDYDQYFLDVSYRSKPRNIDLRLSAPISILKYQESFQAFVNLIRLKSIEFSWLD